MKFSVGDIVKNGDNLFTVFKVYTHEIITKRRLKNPKYKIEAGLFLLGEAASMQDRICLITKDSDAWNNTEVVSPAWRWQREKS